MTTFHDVPAELLLPAVVNQLNSVNSITDPEWASVVKTGIHKERGPDQEDWWTTRCAAILRKVADNGPIGVNHLAQAYGGKDNRNAKPNAARTGSRHIIRTALQQLEESGLVEKTVQRVIESEGEKLTLFKGRVVTGAGQKMLDEAAHSVRGAAEELHPGLAKY